ncbi:Crp/Fnr family transcriptional regulator [Vibrio lamellibrachiae]|uniref:Crp/Fnr family transcriptional regulator n=1 Tax=Vibrio lamellibrachiae TaxID=2910253 RepID=UPI003D09E446
MTHSIKHYEVLLKQYIDPNEYPEVYQFFYLHAKPKEYQEGEYLFEQGEVTSIIAVMISGEIELSYIDEHGSYVQIEKCHEGFWYGDGTFVDHQPMAYSAQVLSNVKVLYVPESLFLSDNAPIDQFYRFICKNLMSRLRIMYHKFDSITTLPLTERILQRLKALKNEQSEIKITHQELAEFLSVSRYKVSRTVKKMEIDGYLVQKYGLITLLNN